MKVETFSLTACIGLELGRLGHEKANVIVTPQAELVSDLVRLVSCRRESGESEKRKRRSGY